MTEKKEAINFDELTPVEKLLGKKLLDVQALGKNNRMMLQQILEKQIDFSTKQNAEIEMLKEQNALLEEQVLRLTQIQETLYKQILYVNNVPGMADALYAKHNAELDKFAETHSKNKEESFKK